MTGIQTLRFGCWSHYKVTTPLLAKIGMRDREGVASDTQLVENYEGQIHSIDIIIF